MRLTFALAILAVVGGLFGAEKTDKPKDNQNALIAEYKDKLQVFTDADGGTYAVHYVPRGESHLFYGEGTTLYRQIIVGGGADGDAWDISTYSPRVTRSLRGSFMRAKDGTYKKFCADNEPEEFTDLTLLGDEAAKKVIAKSKFVTSATFYVPFALARDEKGVYYYVDVLTSEYSGKGYRLWVGKKGRMKQIPLSDVSDDTGGAVFSTKTGDLHFAVDLDYGKGGGDASEATWVRGEKVTKLKPLNAFANTWLIHSELGIYKFIGTLCENQRLPPDTTRLPR
jgi:hypothetical protein